jgi:ABC-type transport system involved in multi-copper enzyme maturation permease subunit
MNVHPLDTWHRMVRTQDASGLSALLAEDAVFHSPVVWTEIGRSAWVCALYTVVPLAAAWWIFDRRDVAGA